MGDNMLPTPLELSILPRERPRLSQRLMLMLSMEIMDMVLVTLLDMALATPDPSMEDTLPSPDPLFPAMLLQSSPDQLLLPQLLPAMLPQLLPLPILVLPDPLFPAMPVMDMD